MIPNFKIIDFKTEDDKFTFKVIIEEDSYVGYIFTFKDISLHPDTNGIGVSYDLEIDFYKGVTPSELLESDIEAIKKTGHDIIEKIISDLVSTINLDIDN